MAFSTIFLGIFLALVGIIITIMLLRSLANVLGLGEWFDQAIWNPINENLIQPILQGLSAPFVWFQNFIMGLLPPEMEPYATILTVAILSVIIFSLIIIAYKIFKNL